MSDKPKQDETATHPPRSDEPGGVKPQSGQASGQAPMNDRPMSDRDEAPPGTPGTAENIDPKTGEKFNEGIGGA